MSYAQVAQHFKENAQREKQQRSEKPNEQVVSSANGKYATTVTSSNTASGRMPDSRDSRGKLNRCPLICVQLRYKCACMRIDGIILYNIAVPWLKCLTVVNLFYLHKLLNH